MYSNEYMIIITYPKSHLTVIKLLKLIFTYYSIIKLDANNLVTQLVNTS